MPARLVLLASLILIGCNPSIDDNAVPPSADVNRLEAKLSQNACIGDLDQWERNYRFSRKSGLLTPHSLYPDLDVIEFHLRRVGAVEIRPGRNLVRPRATDWPDSSPIEAVDGRFTVSSGALALSGCKRRT